MTPIDVGRSAPSDATSEGTAYEVVQQSADFQDLRRRFRGFVFPMTAFFLIWYFTYVLLAAYFPSFMSTKLVGLINVGLVLGLLQFVTTFGITIIYVRWADRVLDPRADALRAHMENLGATSADGTAR